MIYYLIFFAGLLLGACVSRPRLFEIAHRIMIGCGYLLIALFGFQMATSFLCGDSGWRDVAAAGVLAVAAATGSVVFSFLLLVAVEKRSSATKATRPAGDCTVGSPEQSIHPWRPVCGSLALLLGGLVSGIFLPAVAVGSAIKLFLFLLILTVGFQSAQELRTFSGRTTSSKGVALFVLLVLPVAVIAGTLCFCAGTGLFLKYGWRDSMLCGAAMGWQTLGGPLVQELRGPALGNVAFLVNLFRDVIALLMIPLVSRSGYALLSVTPGGVSSMDILLPGIMAASGRHVLLHAMWVGASCSFWAPLLIYLIARGAP